MATTTSDPKTISLKLLVNKCTNKVMFAEAGKDFVDFILSFLTMPIGSIVDLLKTNQMVGSIGNLYGSFELLSDTFMQPSVSKSLLLKPQMQSSSQNLLQLEHRKTDSEDCTYYCCYKNSYDGYDDDDMAILHFYVTTTKNTPCPSCKSSMDQKLDFVGRKKLMIEKEAERLGYVKEVVTYMIMDDLAISPMSSISSITLINKLGVRDIGSLDEKMVTVDFDEGIKLLKASLQSSTVLTDVFLK